MITKQQILFCMGLLLLANSNLFVQFVQALSSNSNTDVVPYGAQPNSTVSADDDESGSIFSASQFGYDVGVGVLSCLLASCACVGITVLIVCCFFVCVLCCGCMGSSLLGERQPLLNKSQF